MKAKGRGGQWGFPTFPKRVYPWSSLTKRWMFCRFWGLWFPLWKCQWTMCAPQVAGWWSLHWLWLKVLARGLAAFGAPWLAQASLDLENLELMQRWINTLETEVADSYFHRGQISHVPEWSQPKCQAREYRRPRQKGTVASQLPLTLIIQGCGSRVLTFSRKAKCLMCMLNTLTFKYWHLINALVGQSKQFAS